MLYIEFSCNISWVSIQLMGEVFSNAWMSTAYPRQWFLVILHALESVGFTLTYEVPLRALADFTLIVVSQIVFPKTDKKFSCPDFLYL